LSFPSSVNKQAKLSFVAQGKAAPMIEAVLIIIKVSPMMHHLLPTKKINILPQVAKRSDVLNRVPLH
jgi:hypothetical protein